MKSVASGEKLGAATVIGAHTSVGQLRGSVGTSAGEARRWGDTVWVRVPAVEAQAVARVTAARASMPLMVITVVVPLGQQGENLDARLTRVAPTGDLKQENCSEWARGTLAEWRDDAPGGFDEDVAANDLAWALAESLSLAKGPHAEARQREAVWSRAIVDKLLAADHLALTKEGARSALESKLAQELQPFGRWQLRRACERVYTVLLDSSTVAEVKGDAEQVAEAVRTSFPTAEPAS